MPGDARRGPQYLDEKTQDLQQAVRDGLCEIPRLPMEKNPADITTKAVDM